MAGNTIEEIKHKLSIVDVVAPYVKLTKAGKYMKGLSPFTREKTPSFFVSPDRGSYYCFSSNQGGDIFTFIEKMEGVDFKGALKILAEKAGVDIVYESKEQKSERDHMYHALTLAEQFYREKLRENEGAKEYAKSRGITGETARTWGLGYAPDEWRAFLTYAEGRGIKTKVLLNVGLIKESEGKKGTYYDRFRNRLMFPIRDIAGRVVGFSGRTLDPEESAKYLNSPETPVYHKSDILYGLDVAKQSMRARGYVLVVEGQMDLVLAHQAGFQNTIALSGTAFTPTHLSLIHRFTKNIMLALDSDRAGIQSMEKSALQATLHGSKVKVVPLPSGSDPADIIKKDPHAFKEMVKKSIHVIDFLAAHYASSTDDVRKNLALVEEHVLPLVGAIQSPIEREHFIGEVAHVLNVSAEAVREALMQHKSGAKTSDTIQVPEVLSPEKHARTTKADILKVLVEEYTAHDAHERILQTAAMIAIPDTVSEKVYFEVGQTFGEKPTKEDIELFCVECEKEWVKEQLRTLREKLAQAERLKEEARIEAYTKEITDLTKKLQSYT